MKKIVLMLLMVLPLVAGAQTKIKETAVPRSVLLALEKTYDSYKVRTWYQAPGQYIAELVIDGQNGRSYFTAGGDWQYSTFPVKAEECPTLMNTYFVNNYPGYRIKSIDYVEEMSGDNYYRMIIVKKGVGSNDCELIFDTRGKLQKSTAPDPDAVKRDYYTHNNPEATGTSDGKTSKADRKRPHAVPDVAADEKPQPSQAILDDFNKRNPPARILRGPNIVARGYDEFAIYFINRQKVSMEYIYDAESNKLKKTGKTLIKERYTSAILKYLDEKYKGEKYKVEKMVVYEYDAKYRDADGKKPKPVTYVVISQKVRGQKRYTRMEFDNTSKFIGLLAQPYDELDIQ